MKQLTDFMMRVEPVRSILHPTSRCRARSCRPTGGGASGIGPCSAVATAKLELQ
jgi:hypothetical protein